MKTLSISIAIVVAIVLFTPVLLADDDDFGTLTYDGKTYSQARLHQITSGGAEFNSQQGTFTIPLDKVPFQVKSRFKKDYDKAMSEYNEASGTSSTQTIAPREPQLTAAQWQAKAIEKYPEIGVQGSELNKHFVEAYTERRKTTPALFKDPKWPLILADELSRAAETPEAKKTRELAEAEAALPRYSVVMIVDRKIKGGLLLKIVSGDTSLEGNPKIKESLRRISAYWAGIPPNQRHNAEGPHDGRFVLRGHPNQEELVDGDVVACLSVADGVASVGGSTYKAFRWVPLP